MVGYEPAPSTKNLEPYRPIPRRPENFFSVLFSFTSELERSRTFLSFRQNSFKKSFFIFFILVFLFFYFFSIVQRGGVLLLNPDPTPSYALPTNWCLQNFFFKKNIFSSFFLLSLEKVRVALGSNLRKLEDYLVYHKLCFSLSLLSSEKLNCNLTDAFINYFCSDHERKN